MVVDGAAMVDCFAWLVDPAWLVSEVKQGAAGLTGFAGRLQYTVHSLPSWMSVRRNSRSNL
jgi:hypothetical protein